MTTGSISIQSNLSLILIVIIIVLLCVYFYLDLRKLKLQISNLEKNNESFINEFDKINMGIHTIFKNGVKINEEENKENKENKEIIQETNGEDVKNDNNIEIKEVEESDKSKEDILKDISQSNINEEPQSNLDDELFFNLNNKKSNNIFGEIKETNNSGNILMSDDNNEINMNILDMTDVLSDDIEELSDELPDELSGELPDEVYDNIEELENGKKNLDKGEYLDMSIKELKEKCIELGLKHSGNKHTLANRIVDKLK